MIKTVLEIMQSDIVIVSGFISALPDHKTVIDSYIKENYRGIVLVCRYLKWLLEKFGYGFKMSDFYKGALEDDVLPVKLANFLAECYLQYLECSQIEGVIEAMSDKIPLNTRYKANFEKMNHAKRRAELLFNHIKATKENIAESLGLDAKDV